MELSSRIHKLRTRHNLTLQQVADRCGVTRSMLSKIENGHAAPSVATLTRIAEALGVPVSLLLQQGGSSPTVYTPADQAAELTATQKGYRFRPLCAGRIEKMMQPLLFVAKKGEIAPGAMRHGGEEFIYVLEGRMRYRVGTVTRELGPGDSLYFDAEEPHDLEPLTTVKYLGVFAEAPREPQQPAKRRSRPPGKKRAKPRA